MKKILAFTLLVAAFAGSAIAQEDKSKRPSPPAQNTFALKNGTKIVIDYSQPAVKGRTIGKEIAPYGQVWRTGANDATTFEVSKDIWIEGEKLSAGKYAVFTIPTENEWTVIFNKTSDKNPFNYKEANDVLRVKVKPVNNPNFAERMAFTMDNGDKIVLNWGNVSVPVSVK